jgi:predicted phosphodiesterase
MRIIHFSDIHLAYDNYQYFVTVFRRALINDLKSQLSQGSFELVVISGDLVDKGGFTLYDINQFKGREKELSPFQIFEQVFIDPISKELAIPKNKFLFVPGNHDVDERNILLKTESDLVKKIISGKPTITEILEANETNFEYSKRIECFKKFEENYHSTNNDYDYTNNHSTFIYQSEEGVKYGFLLLNDSWRCKSVRLLLEKECSFNLNLGSKQIYDGLDLLKKQNADVIICVMHHPLEKFNDKQEIEGIFMREDIDLVLFGDLHATKFRLPQSDQGGYISSQCKASYSNQNKMHIEYLCGYQILEITKSSLSSISFRYFDGRTDKSQFYPDPTMGDYGISRNHDGLGFPFHRKRKIDLNNESNFRN